MDQTHARQARQRGLERVTRRAMGQTWSAGTAKTYDEAVRKGDTRERRSKAWRWKRRALLPYLVQPFVQRWAHIGLAHGHYIERDGIPKMATSLLVWALWTENADRQIAETFVRDVRVSTVFLGLDVNYGHGTPVVYETMIFGGKHDQYQERYSTRAEAMEGHRDALAMVTDPPDESHAGLANE